jgi:hypothetical protein
MYSKSRKMTNKELQKKVVKVAKGYVGMQEIKGNLGWTSKEFEAKMESVGWKSTHAWCVLMLDGIRVLYLFLGLLLFGVT